MSQGTCRSCLVEARRRVLLCKLHPSLYRSRTRLQSAYRSGFYLQSQPQQGLVTMLCVYSRCCYLLCAVVPRRCLFYLSTIPVTGAAHILKDSGARRLAAHAAPVVNNSSGFNLRNTRTARGITWEIGNASYELTSQAQANAFIDSIRCSLANRSVPALLAVNTPHRRHEVTAHSQPKRLSNPTIPS